MTYWKVLEEPIDTTWIGFAPLDLYTNYGVPIGWMINTATGASQEGAVDVTP